MEETGDLSTGSGGGALRGARPTLEINTMQDLAVAHEEQVAQLEATDRPFVNGNEPSGGGEQEGSSHTRYVGKHKYETPFVDLGPQSVRFPSNNVYPKGPYDFDDPPPIDIGTGQHPGMQLPSRL